jgi:RND superfamily putative drug exporter
MAGQLLLAADGAWQIVDGARRAQEQVTDILGDPVGRRALDRLLITPSTVRDFPELKRSLEAYISPDGHFARIDIAQTDRFFSTDAMSQVSALRHRVGDFLHEQDDVPISGFGIAGANAESADIWAVTQHDQVQIWVVVPLGVFLVLLLALRDPWSCLNLVATMIATYLFALGVTHLVFVTWLGADGIDWKVPLFLFVLLVAVGVDYNIFLMSRLQREVSDLGLRAGIQRAIAHTGGLITSAAAITACSFASFLISPLASIRQLGFALVVGIAIDALLVRPVLVPCGHWLIHRGRLQLRRLRRDGGILQPHVSVRD